CDPSNPIEKPLPGFKPSKPVVFCGIFPVDNSEHQKLKDGLAKLKLNDSSFSHEAESSTALGLGFRCGFLGLLHLEIVQERLEREYELELITTAPTVLYHVITTEQELVRVENPADLPDSAVISEIREPFIRARILTPQDQVGPIISLCIEKRGLQQNINYHGRQVLIEFDLPLAEVVLDFH
ncbi:MAG TPA: elongation factor 4, partial [Pseudomonadales bacterium]|nr:elongation factor 4 [Pseudomonadales bacterium]